MHGARDAARLLIVVTLALMVPAALLSDPAVVAGTGIHRIDRVAIPPFATPPAGEEIEIAVTTLSCPNEVSGTGAATEFLAGVLPADLEQQGCHRATEGDVRFALLAMGPEGTEPEEVARAWTDANGDAKLTGSLVPGVTSYQIDELDLTYTGSSSRSAPLSPPFAPSYTVVNRDEWTPAGLSIRALTCPIGTADPTTSCRDNRVDRAVWDEFDVRPSDGGGWGEDDPSLISVDTEAGLVSLAARPTILSQYAGAYVSCVDDATGTVIVAGPVDATGVVTLQLRPQSGTSCEWYYLTPADGATSVSTSPSLRPVPIDAPGFWVLSEDGAVATNLTGSLPTAGFPAWSPDGRRVAFLDGGSRLITVDVPGGVVEQVSDRQFDAVPPSWSPDGRYLLVATADGGIYAVAVDGSGETKIGDQRTLLPLLAMYVPWVRQSAWSPNGDLIAYPALAPDGQGMELNLVRADGTHPVPLTDLPDDAFVMFPAWSPDGEEIAFELSRQESGFCGVMVVRHDGTRLRQVGGCGGAAWSPDGTRLLIDVYLGDGASQIDLASADGSWIVGLTGQGNYASPSWSADGTRIAFVGGDLVANGVGVTVMNADGSDPVRFQAPVGSEVWFGFVSWAPDGARLLVQAQSDSGDSGD